MKKFALAAVAAAAMVGGVAQAYTVGTFSNGVVVPNVIHNGAGDTTAVGLINQTGTAGSNNGSPVAVYWTFFDQNSNHITDGCFGMTGNQYTSFDWSQQSGLGLAGVRGYLVFAAATSTGSSAAAACAASDPAAAGTAWGGQISANAFQVNVAGQTVAYTPVIDGPLNLAAGSNLTTLGPLSLLSVAGAATVAPGPGATPTLSMRYFVDSTVNPGGNDTRIAVWSTGDQTGVYTVNMYDNTQQRKSVNFGLDHAELAWFDPEAISGRPAAFTDGFINWTVNAAPAVSGGGITAAATANSLYTLGGSVFAYSVVSSSSFGATQSLLGAHR